MDFSWGNISATQCVERSNFDINGQCTLAKNFISPFIRNCSQNNVQYVLAREEWVNSSEIILHMCHWNEDRSKFKGKGQRTLAKQAFIFYPSSAADGPSCHIMFFCLKKKITSHIVYGLQPFISYDTGIAFIYYA